jgi:hypothetical protein
MATQWYYQNAGEECGPVAFRDLVELVRAGTITETDLVRSSWKAEWQRAYSVVGLFHMAGRSAEELDQLYRPALPSAPEPVVDDAPADLAALDNNEVLERPGWLTRLFSTTDRRKERPSENPIVGKAIVDTPAVKSTSETGQVHVAATASTNELSPELAEYCSSAASSPGSEAWSSAVDEAMARANSRAAGRNPAAGRWARLVQQLAQPFAATYGMRQSPWIRPAFRLICAIICANLAALAIVEWSAEEDRRFPASETTGSQDTGRRQFPIVGECGSGEYMFLVCDAMLVAGAAGYFGARWLDSRAD